MSNNDHNCIIKPLQELAFSVFVCFILVDININLFLMAHVHLGGQHYDAIIWSST